MNNKFHETAAKTYTNCLVDFKLPSDIWLREAVKAARLDGSIFANLVKYRPIGAHLSWLYKRLEFKFFWDPFNAPYMPHLNPEWYLKTRFALDFNSTLFKDFNTSPPEFTQALAYNKVITYNGCAAIGTVGDGIMDALDIMGDLEPYNKAAHQHRLFGCVENDLGKVNTVKLGAALRVFFLGALKSMSKSVEELIPSHIIKHNVVDYKVTLDIFDKQSPYLKESRELVDAAKEKKVDREKELERLQTEKGLERFQAEKELEWIQAEEEMKRLKAEEKLKRLKSEKLPQPYSEHPKVLDAKDIPYELLY